MVRSEPWLRRKKTRFPQSPTSRWKDFFSYSEEFRARGAALFTYSPAGVVEKLRGVILIHEAPAVGVFCTAHQTGLVACALTPTHYDKPNSKSPTFFVVTCKAVAFTIAVDMNSKRPAEQRVSSRGERERRERATPG